MRSEDRIFEKLNQSNPKDRKSISLYLSESLLEKLQGEHEGHSISRIVETLIEEYLQSKEEAA